MSWLNYPLYAFIAASCWLGGLILLYGSAKIKRRGLPIVLIIIGTLSLIFFGISIWYSLERPAIRTMAETKLWFSVILSVISLVYFMRWQHLWLLTYAHFFALIFLIFNFIAPDPFDKTMMPSLKSYLFIPHVSAYLVGYSMMVISGFIGINGISRIFQRKNFMEMIHLADKVVWPGLGFLTCGLLFGLLWAKKTWGHYWNWDPKEIFALLSWLIYIIYIHLRVFQKNAIFVSFCLLVLAVFILLFAWLGIDYLPFAWDSMHSFSEIQP